MITEFGKALRKIREQNYDSLTDMASKIGISPAYILEIEHGKRNVSAFLVEMIIAAYGLHDKQAMELKAAANGSIKTAEINLDGVCPCQRELAVLIASEIKKIDDNLARRMIEDIKKELKGK